MTDNPDPSGQTFGLLQVLSAGDLLKRDFPKRPRRGNRPVEMDQTPVAIRGEPLHEVWWRGRQWAVTAFGVECLDGSYVIKASRLAEEIDSFGWPEHMSEKEWCDIEDFSSAWLVALAMHRTKVPGGKAAIRTALGRARLPKEPA
jgi:hypothetical protein